MNLSNPVYDLKIANEINVTVPASLQLMTPYVLREQHDWFEDEIKFLRTFIKPGMKVIDIGANYGLYTLTIAKIIGNQGRLWAFEPTTATSAYLKQSIFKNNFTNIELIQAGLSDRNRKAKFFTGPNSELNSLSNKFVSGNQHETISLYTLDYCANKYQWGEIDFIKLDAEGEESNILKTGKKFLSSMSPLIMFELKHGEKVNLSLINRFKKLGYGSYRLIPGLNTLVPFNPAKSFDDYLLNLFCCKKDKATVLESEGVIVKQWEKQECSFNSKVVEKHFSQLLFRQSLDKEIFDSGETAKDYLGILTAYILSYSESTSPTEKVGYLMAALNGLRNMLENSEPQIEQLATFARIAVDAGERALGVNILSDLIKKHDKNLDFEITEPFLPASAKYESISPNKKIKEWLLSSILEQYIKTHAFSSYFTQRKSLPLLEKLSNLGFMDEEMERRQEMIKYCF